MDPLSHLVAGGIQGNALRPVVEGKRLVCFCVPASWIPDIDNVVGFLGPRLYLIHHRGVTHSFIGGLVPALFFTAVFRLWDRTLPLAMGCLVAYAGIVNHIFLDLINSYGTQIFAPLSRARYSVQCVFIIDPVFTLSMALFLVWLWLRPRSRTRIACFALAWLLVYPLCCLAVREGLGTYLQERLRRQGHAFSHLELSTEAFTPFRWKLILDTGEHYQMAGVSLLDPDVPLQFEVFTKADRHLLERLGRQVPLFRTYAWFAMYPVMMVEVGVGGPVITFKDLRFRSTLDFVRRLFQGRDGPFTLTARLDDRGRLLAYSYARSRPTKVIQHLE